MGSTSFMESGKGYSPEEVFEELVEEARREYGNRYDSGTIGTKGGGRGFVLVKETKQSLLVRVERSLREAEADEARRRANGTHGNFPPEDGRAGRLREELKALQAKEVLSAQDVAECLLHVLWEAPFSDPYGDAGCVLVKAPGAVTPMTAAQARKRAQEKWGPSAVVKVYRGSLLGRPSVQVLHTVPKPTGTGVWTPKPGGYEGPAALAYGKDVAEARGRLFAEPGEWLFFGSAKC